MEERRRRTNVIRKLSSQKRSELGARCLGQAIPILVEETTNGMCSGHSEHYLEVKFKSEQNVDNKIVNVFLEEVCGDWVKGRLV
jgi:tRNA A37 methylthiotransferase MiaB